MLCSVGPPTPPTSNHPRKSRSSSAYAALCFSSRCAISCATELLPEPYTPVMSTAPSTPLFTPASYLLLPAVAIRGAGRSVWCVVGVHLLAASYAIHRSAWRNCLENSRGPLGRASSAPGSG